MPPSGGPKNLGILVKGIVKSRPGPFYPPERWDREQTPAGWVIVHEAGPEGEILLWGRFSSHWV